MKSHNDCNSLEHCKLHNNVVCEFGAFFFFYSFLQGSISATRISFVKHSK